MPTQIDMSQNEILARIDERTKGMAEDVGMLKHVLLEGNGVPPVTVQLATLTAKVAHLDAVDTETRIPKAVWITICVSSLLAVISILIELYKHAAA